MSERIMNVVIDVRNVFENDEGLSIKEKEEILKDFSEKEKVPFEFLKKSVLTKYNLSDLLPIMNRLDELSNDRIGKMFDTFGYYLSLCPASTKYHNCYYGGWLDHTIDVVKKADKLSDVWFMDKELWSTPAFNAFEDSVDKSALLHDVGKLGLPDMRMYLPNPDESNIAKEPFIFNESLVQLPHEMYSILLCNKFSIDLTPEEFQAIAYHNLYYLDSAKEALRYKECPLTLIIHTADNLTAKILEK
ncbi:MAG: hypothetical protein JW915_24165 [Chitinispirillaceae bacterium]|nr:hypothetical protein [Chitinispirillaceae bacterium]